MAISGWVEKRDKGNVVYAFEKGDWGVALIAPDKYHPDAELRFLNFKTEDTFAITGSPSIMLKKSKKELLDIADRHILRRGKLKKVM